MPALIARIAAYLISKWSSFSSLTKWALAAVAGSALYDAVAAGTQALISFLGSLSETVINAIANLLGF